jgi:hypothetical protein
VGEGESQEREKQEGQGLKYPSVRFGIIRLVRTLWFMLIGGWEVRKCKLGGIVTLGNWNLRVQWETETHRRHYCQYSSLLFFKEGGIVFVLASSSWQGVV